MNADLKLLQKEIEKTKSWDEVFEVIYKAKNIVDRNVDPMLEGLNVSHSGRELGFSALKHSIVNYFLEFESKLSTIQKEGVEIPKDIGKQFRQKRLEANGIFKLYQRFLDLGLDNRELSAAEIFDMALKPLKKLMKTKNQTFSIEGLEALKADKTKVIMRKTNYQIFTIFENLIQNAAKYTPEGGDIKVKFEYGIWKFPTTRSRVIKLPSVIKSPSLLFTVTDTGIGFPSGEIEDIIKRGKRGSNAVASGIKGTGLSLQKVVRYLAGFDYIKIISEIGLGTKITCVL